MLQQAVPPKYMDIYRTLELLMGAKNNHAAYRQRLHSVIDVPCIPYLGKLSRAIGMAALDVSSCHVLAYNPQLNSHGPMMMTLWHCRNVPDRPYLSGGRERQHAREWADQLH